MTGKPIVVIGLGGGLLALLLGWSLPTMLQSSQQKVDSEAALHVEKARRALHQYNAALGYKAGVLNEFGAVLSALGDKGVEGEFDLNDPKVVSDDAKTDYQDRHEAYWKEFRPTNWKLAKSGWDSADAQQILKSVPQKDSASYTNIEQQVSQGSKTRAEAIKQNAGLLQEALKYVDQALAVTSGEASGRTNVEANWLKSIILYHQGLAAASESAALRRQIVPLQVELKVLDAEATGVQPLANLIVGSTIGKVIKEMETRIKDAGAKLSELQAKAGQVDESIRDLKAKVADAEKRAENARKEIDRIKAAGIDFSNTRGGEVFAEQMTAQDKAYRTALRDIQSLKRGHLPKATVDASGDYLKGKYVEGSSATLTTESGLDHFQAERDVLTSEIKGQEAMIKEMEAALDAAKAEEANYKGRTAAASEETNGTDGFANRAGKTHEQLALLDQAAFDLEEKALQTLQKSAESAKAAASASERLISEASSAFRELTPTKQETSALSLRKDDGWMAGYIGASEADARLARAWVLLQRYVAYSENARTYTGLFEYLRLKPGDPTTEWFKTQPDRAKEAKEAGVAEIGQVMTSLGDAHRKAGQHWTITALAGSARSTLILFGYPQYKNEALDDYRNALKGREDKDFARWIGERIAALEATK